MSRSRLRGTGLSRSAMEGVCKVRHSLYYKKFSYAFCPWCGEAIELKHHCDHCGRDFFSEDAYNVHLNQASLYRENRCPNGSEHQVKYMRNRDRFYCVACRFEYAPKRAIEDQESCRERPVDTRRRRTAVTGETPST